MLEAAVVGAPDERWGERPVAFVVRGARRRSTPTRCEPGSAAASPATRCPSRIEVAELPKTASGKIQKDVLRKRMRDAEGVSGDDG